MMGKRKPAGTLFDVGNVFPFRPKPDTFHGQLAEAAPRLFQDEAFQDLYDPRRGRYSVPPSELALLLLLQAEAGCSDEETLERSACDLRWCAVLRKAAGEPLCAKSTFQTFRARLVLEAQADTLLKTSLAEAKRAGLLQGAALRLAIDTKPIIGRGAVLDTYNLLGSAIQKLATALAVAQEREPEAWGRGARPLPLLSRPGEQPQRQHRDRLVRPTGPPRVPLRDRGGGAAALAAGA